MACSQQKIWAYESNWGSFAEYCLVQAQQLLPKPTRLTWEEAASYGLTYFTAYRMLVDRAAVEARRQRAGVGRRRRPGHVRGAAVRAASAPTPIAVVSSDDKIELVRELGATAVHRPPRVRADRSRHRRAQPRRDQAVRQGDPRG